MKLGMLKYRLYKGLPSFSYNLKISDKYIDGIYVLNKVLPSVYSILNKKTISFVGFWYGFDIHDNPLTMYLNYNNDFEILDFDVNNQYYRDIIIFGSFSYIELNFKCLTLLYISEPLCQRLQIYNNVLNNKYDILTGCVDNIKGVKFPLYLLYYNNNKNILNDTNLYIKNSNNLISKKFCCLINTHDNGNTRTNIYEKLSTIDKIDCPGKLYQNYYHELGYGFDKIEFMKNYIFNICPENYNTPIDGYITEKLYESCIAGCIPIYYGVIDDIDMKIFNINRIIVFNPFDYISIDNAYNKILYLINNKQELEKFYKQDIFCEEALETIEILKTNLINKLK